MGEIPPAWRGVWSSRLITPPNEYVKIQRAAQLHHLLSSSHDKLDSSYCGTHLQEKASASALRSPYENARSSE